MDIKCSCASQQRAEIVLLLNQIVNPYLMALAFIHSAYSLYLVL